MRQLLGEGALEHLDERSGRKAIVKYGKFIISRAWQLNFVKDGR